MTSHWPFVAGAYLLVFGVLGVYWWRVERGIRELRRAEGARPGVRPA